MSISDGYDNDTSSDALIRMNEQWGPEGYEITFTSGQIMPWHAKYLPDGYKWHAPTSQRLHMSLYDHWAKDFDFPGLPHNP